MGEELLKLYEEKVGIKNLFKKVNIIIPLLITIISWMLFIFSNWNVTIHVIFLLISIFGMSTFFHQVDNTLKQKYKKIYGNVQSKKEYPSIRNDLILKFLVEKDIYKEKKHIENLINYYSKMIQRRPSSFINWAVLISILLPIWSRFLYLQDDIKILCALGITAFAFVLTIAVFKNMFSELSELFLFNNRYNNMNEIIRCLDSILLDYDFMEYNKKIDLFKRLDSININ